MVSGSAVALPMYVCSHDCPLDLRNTNKNSHILLPLSQVSAISLEALETWHDSLHEAGRSAN